MAPWVRSVIEHRWLIIINIILLYKMLPIEVNLNEIVSYLREIWPTCLCHSIIPLLITAGFIIPFTTGSCSDDKCPVSFHFIIGRNMVDGHALVGHVFANVSVTKVMDCYRACQPNCRCISFNFLKYSNQDNCQLNEENRHLKPGALMAKEDSQYYDIWSFATTLRWEMMFSRHKQLLFFFWHFTVSYLVS